MEQRRRPAVPGARPRLLILGGTAEAIALARRAAASFDVTTSLAGTTENPARPPGRVRIGGFGGAAGLGRYLDENAIDLLIDATHPFAARMQANAAEGCALAGVPRCRLLRPAWQRHADDRWIEVDDIAQAAAAIRSPGRRVFLALGARDLPCFAPLTDHWFLVRGVSPPAQPIANGLFLQARGPFTLGDERRLLVEHRIEVVVSRQSGGEGARAKVDAARALGLPVVMIRRPPAPPPPIVDTVAAAIAWLDRQSAVRPIAAPLAQTGPADAG